MLQNNSKSIPFNHHDPKYQCCCNAIHVKQGARAIAINVLLFITGNIIFKALGLLDIRSNLELILLIINAVVVISLLYGIITENARLLQPFVILNVLTVILLLLLAIFFISAAYDPRSFAAEYVKYAIKSQIKQITQNTSISQEEDVAMTLSVFLTVAVALLALIHCWFIYIIIRCARYFRDLQPIKQSFMDGYTAEWLRDSCLFVDNPIQMQT
ncbi:unnamed protein product [Thelazia callipaeda]|uniref:Uncharacterized protein n=1 Tax=Thelazia callipaeda TaxID=103827 RepID=A0A158RB62_THECL|nr:unnamed protein product [Thelazia callipaeda]